MKPAVFAHFRTKVNDIFPKAVIKIAMKTDGGEIFIVVRFGYKGGDVCHSALIQMLQRSCQIVFAVRLQKVRHFARQKRVVQRKLSLRSRAEDDNVFFAGKRPARGGDV